MTEPTTAEMIAWCEEGAAECDSEALDHRHFCEPTGEEEAKAEATMLRAIAERLRRLEEGR